MSLLGKLVDCGFLTKLDAELETARELLHQGGDQEHFDQESDPEDQGVRHYGLDDSIRKRMYDEIIVQYSLKEGMRSVDRDNDWDELYYVHMNYCLFVFSRSKREVNKALEVIYNLNGDLPVYRTKHRVSSLTYHTALVDTRYSFDPISPN